MTGTPYIPETITVHLGAPRSEAQNVTVSFSDYIKNVASSEIFPTWPESALRANIYAQISFALNRVYTEWYRSQGFDFDITNSTAFDQSFVHNRNIFENVSRIVDEIFDDYISRREFLEPLFAQFCDGIKVTCDGLSQWGSVDLANDGYIPYNILTYYYGDDIDIVTDAPIQALSPSYDGTPLRLGDTNDNVRLMQLFLNRISTAYPLIPKINNPDGIFAVDTDDAVRAFQETFNLTVDGVIGKATWYQIIYIYIAVQKLADVNSNGILVSNVPKQFVGALEEGDTGDLVRSLQYYLSTIALYNNAIQNVEMTGDFNAQTKASVISFQKEYGLEATGTINEATWAKLNDVYLGIVNDNPPDYINDPDSIYPGTILRLGSSGDAVRTIQTELSYISETYPSIPKITATGYFGSETQNAVTAYQREFGITARGIVGPLTWNSIRETYDNLRIGDIKNPGQYPGYELKEE